MNVNLKLLSKSLSANLPIIVKIVPLRESIKAGLPVQKYDWINVQEYITIYKAFVDKLALYVVDTKGNTQAMKDDVYFDLGVLATLTTNYTASVTKLDAFHNISMSAIIALVDPSTLNSPFINVYTVINTLVGKVPPLSINDVNVALASLFSDQNTIKSLFYRLSLAYDRLPAQLNIALNQLTMLANMQTQFAGAASSFATGILAFGTQAKIQFTAFKQVFLKIMSDEYLLTRTAVTSIEAQLNAINDYSEIQINPQVIAAYEQFVVTHQARLKVANFTVNNALEGYYNFVLGFDYSDYAQLKSGYLEFRDTLLVILLSTSVPVVI